MAQNSGHDPKDQHADLDDTDRAILTQLQADGRMTNAELAARVQIAPSTAHQRVRSLVGRGVINGFHASLNAHRLGLGLQAMIGVTLRPGARQENIERFSRDVRELPDVQQVYFLGGADDFLVHVAVADASALREFVVANLSAHASVASTRTSIIFDYHRNGVVSSFR